METLQNEVRLKELRKLKTKEESSKKELELAEVQKKITQSEATLKQQQVRALFVEKKKMRSSKKFFY